ncbi:DUF4890 domain-containing protein [Sinomicrobium weinanense]|uniref:DUF4890 domain-containing protein n=1 Tax=Sinomicrobium weinanense TaxID=2842200 RepID=A0A926JSY6_9FLAO|nr:DUF4890 domain-containing protein [Sinomicrobium weinanense]MBC9796677.1 DUF4890 domain-containing protein [Sinomicrobium weinanense]MBU3124927.1 DUF4890 domain-containing protein [Sinomicrobium weinanense]
MKKLLSLAIALILVTGVMAQEKTKRRTERKMHRTERFKDFTPQQRAELRTKQMALKLDLNETQQKKVLKLNTELAEKRKANIEKFKKAKQTKKEWSVDERFAFINERLDARLELQHKMKDILNEDQYATWKKSSERHKRFPRHKKRHFHR